MENPQVRKVPSSTYRNLLSHPLLENNPFLAIFRQFLDPAMFMENLPKKGPLLREFWTHMDGTAYTRTLNMLCTPSSGVNFLEPVVKYAKRMFCIACVQTLLAIVNESQGGASFVRLSGFLPCPIFMFCSTFGRFFLESAIIWREKFRSQGKSQVPPMFARFTNKHNQGDTHSVSGSTVISLNTTTTTKKS